MQNYTKLVTDLINQEIDEYITWYDDATRLDAIEHMQNKGFEGLFDEIDGDYAETFDVKACELLVSQVLSGMVVFLPRPILLI